MFGQWFGSTYTGQWWGEQSGPPPIEPPAPSAVITGSRFGPQPFVFRVDPLKAQLLSEDELILLTLSAAAAAGLLN